jgi:ketosteroid isomerase-like protein
MFNSITEQDESIRTVNKLYDAFKRRDISSILDMFTDDAILHGPTTTGVVPWGGTHKVVGERRNSSLLLASHLNPKSLSYATLLLKVTRLQYLDIKRGKPSLQDDYMRSSLYIYGQYMMENSLTEFRIFNDTAALVEALRR